MARTLSELKVIDNPNYKKIGKAYLKAVEEIQHQKKSGIKREVIIENTLNDAANISQQVKAFREQELSQIYGAMDVIKGRYKTVIEDPTRELLRRQDIELKLKTMNDSELLDYANTIAEHRPSVFELQTLQTLLKDRPIEVRKSAEGALLNYKFSHHPGEEWRNDEGFNALQEELSEMAWIPEDGLYYRADGQSSELQSVPSIESSLLAEIGNYQ